MATYSKFRVLDASTGIPTTINLSTTGNILKSDNFEIGSASVTASKPLKLDGSKQFTSGNIDLTTEVTGALPDSNLATITTANKVSGSAVQLVSGEGLENSSGLKVKVTDLVGDGIENDGSNNFRVKLNGATLDRSASGLKVADLGINTAQLTDGAITNVKVNASAAIDFSKMAALTIDRALISSGSGVVSASSVTTTELGHVSGVTSPIQTQIAGKVSKSGDTMTGDLAMGANKITSSYVPVSGTDLVNKTYVDNSLSGNTWKDAVNAFNLLGNLGFAAINALSPLLGDQYVVTDSGTLTPGSLAVVAGDIVEYQTNPPMAATAWVKIESGVGGFVANGVRAALAGFSGTVGAPYTNSTDQDKIVRFDGTSLTGIFTTDTADKNSILVQDSGSISYFDNSAYVYEGTPITGHWVQFNGAGQIAAGVGLIKSGNTLSVLLGAGIKELPTGEVGIDVASNGGLELTSNLTTGQLQVKVDAITIDKGGSGIFVKDAGISDVKLASDSVTTAKILNLNVTTAKLAATSVTAAKLGNDVVSNGLTGGNGSAISALSDTVGGANLAKAVNVSANGLAVKVDGSTIEGDGTTGQLRIKDAGVTNAKMATNSVGTSNIIDANVTTAKLAGSITDDKLSQLTTANKVAGSAVQLVSGEGIENSTGLKVKVADLVGNGIEDDGSNNFRVKINGTSLALSGSGLSLNVSNANTWTSQQNFNGGMSSTKYAIPGTAGESFAADKTYAVRLALSGETAGRVYKASKLTPASNLYFVDGVIQATSLINAGDSVEVIFHGRLNLLSSDTNMSASSEGLPLFLHDAGVVTDVVPASGLSTNTPYASVILGQVVTRSATVTDTVIKIKPRMVMGVDIA